MTNGACTSNPAIDVKLMCPIHFLRRAVGAASKCKMGMACRVDRLITTKPQLNVN